MRISRSSAMPTSCRQIESTGEWGRYLDKYPELAADLATVELTPDLMMSLRATNRRLNRKRWQPEEGDDWDHTLPGDCENFCLAKRRELANAVLPLGALRVCVGQIRRRNRVEHHAVLHVVTDRGDYVLDNLTDKVLPWKRSRLKPLYRTAAQRSYVLAVQGRKG